MSLRTWLEELEQSTSVSEIKVKSTFQPPEEGWSVQRPKPCDKHGNKDEDNSPKNANNVQMYKVLILGIR